METRHSNAFCKRFAAIGNSFVAVLWLVLASPGWGEPENLLKLKAHAEAGDAFDQFAVGSWYISGGRGVEKNLSEAVRWFRKAADQGNFFGQDALADCYAKGRGVVKDIAEAARWYRKAAEQGDLDAQTELGLCYSYSNSEGVPKDFVEAAKWFRKAAEEDYATAEYLLGICHFNGDGVPKNLSAAAGWFRKASEQNHPAAQLNLGLCYSNGDGVPRDYLEAYKWANLSAAQGDADAAKLRERLEKQMAPDQIAEAQHLSREFKPRDVLEVIKAQELKHRGARAP